MLDEPSNALDLSAQKDLQGLMRKLAAQGTSILLITHHLPDIIPEIDRILMMKEGRIVGDGPKSELLTEEKLGELFGSPRAGRSWAFGKSLPRLGCRSHPGVERWA